MLSCIVYRQLNCRYGDESEGDNDKKNQDKAEMPQSTPLPEIQDIPKWVHRLNEQSFLSPRILFLK